MRSWNSFLDKLVEEETSYIEEHFISDFDSKDDPVAELFESKKRGRPKETEEMKVEKYFKKVLKFIDEAMLRVK